jgi:hypothetical protein
VDPVRIAALIGFIAVAGLVVYVVLRSREVGRESRGSQAYRDAVRSVADRVDASLVATLGVLDEVRHHRLGAGDALPELGAALTAIDAFVAEVSALEPSAPSVGLRDALVADLHRAERALDRTQHGCQRLAGASARASDSEAQMAIRRGYLELQHARESFARHAADIPGAGVGAGRSTTG